MYRRCAAKGTFTNVIVVVAIIANTEIYDLCYRDTYNTYNKHSLYAKIVYLASIYVHYPKRLLRYKCVVSFQLVKFPFVRINAAFFFYIILFVWKYLSYKSGCTTNHSGDSKLGMIVVNTMFGFAHNIPKLCTKCTHK